VLLAATGRLNPHAKFHAPRCNLLGARGPQKLSILHQFRYFLATLAPSSECIVGSMIDLSPL